MACCWTRLTGFFEKSLASADCAPDFEYLGTLLNIIPDIHADPERLNTILDMIDHDAPIAFLGDFIDAGSGVKDPDDGFVLRRVRQLIEDGKASGVMGNHELNAILYHRVDQGGRPLREHSEKNTKQHRSFINQFGVASKEALGWTEWFLANLPLWRELDDTRLVHACWSSNAIETIAERRPDGYLHVEDLEEIAREATPFGQAVKTLVSGIEVKLPSDVHFTDFSGHKRREVRIAWWRNNAHTWRSAALSVPDPLELPDSALPADIQSEIYAADAKPVFVGHYKMSGNPVIERPNVACLDYPQVPCTYLWKGESTLLPENIRTGKSSDRVC